MNLKNLTDKIVLSELLGFLLDKQAASQVVDATLRKLIR